MSSTNLGIILLSGVLTFATAPSAFSQTSPEKSQKPATTQKATPEHRQDQREHAGSKSDQMHKDMSANQDHIRQAQQALKDKGMYTGTVDGKMNAQTEKALRDFQTGNNMKATGKLDHDTMMKLGMSMDHHETDSQKMKHGDDKSAPAKPMKKGGMQSRNSSEEVREIQTALQNKGMDPGPIDGVMGPKTKRAIADFQRQQNLYASGNIDQQTRTALGVDSTNMPAERNTDSDMRREKPRGEVTPPSDEFYTQPGQHPRAADPGTNTFPRASANPHTAHPSAVPQLPEASTTQVTPGTQSTLGVGTASSVEDLRQMQMALKNRGYDPGEINGLISSDTQRAVRDFQAANNLPVTGILDERTQAALGVSIKGTANPDAAASAQLPAADQQTDVTASTLQKQPEMDIERAKPSQQDRDVKSDKSDKAEKPEKSDKSMTDKSGKMDKDVRERLDNAANVLQDMTKAGDKRIPQELLQRAEAIAVIPHVVKGAMGIGGRYGKGVVVRRMANGRWGAPAFVSIGGGSFGAQIGVTATDLVLVFLDPASAKSLEKGTSLKLGAEAGVAAGPIGRSGEAGVTHDLKSGILAYSRSKGLFAGVSLDGAVLDMDGDTNRDVYGASAETSTILSSDSKAANQAVRQFMETVNRVVPAKKVSERQ
jgi:SH3 domain-containing YSC84-like protein 1